MSDPKQDKTQKSVSLPKIWYDEVITETFNQYKKELAYFDITTPAGLLKASTKWGLPLLLKQLSEVPQEEKMLSSLPHEERKSDDKSHKKTVPNHPG